jgi:hypothetical protein
MTGRAGPSLISALWLALAGCEREPTPLPASSPSAAPTPEASVSPLPEPTARPSPVASAEPASVPARTFAPQDDCATAPGWPAFHKSLVAAVRARDVTALAALSSADVTLDYGGGNGVEELQKRLADPDRELWQELEQLLPLGCAVEGGLAAMPWVFWNVPDNTDSYSAMLVTGQDVPLRDGPTGKALGNVGWAIVDIDPMSFKPDAKTTPVTLGNGDKGWVETAKLRSLLDYRLIAEPKDGTWQITAFIAGD